MRTITCLLGLALLLPAIGGAASPAGKTQATYADQAHARAVDAFRAGRFPEAYGRFVSLANAGHSPSARHALWMCAQGCALFGRDWDCAPHEIDDWARLARTTVPEITACPYSPPGRVAKPVQP